MQQWILQKKQSSDNRYVSTRRITSHQDLDSSRLGRENWISNHTLNEEGATVRQRWLEQSVERCCVCCVLPFAWYLGADEKHNLHTISIRLKQPDGACRFVPVCFWAATRKTLPLKRVREQANVERNFSWEISLENFLYFGAKTFLTNIQSRAAEVDSLKRVSCFFVFPFRVWTNNSI